MQFLACLGDQLASTAVTCGLYVKMDARKNPPKGSQNISNALWEHVWDAIRVEANVS